MFLPKFTITNKTLGRIAEIEHCKGVIESTTILPTWQKQIEKEARIKTIAADLKSLRLNAGPDLVKKYIDGLESSSPKEIMNLAACLDYVSNSAGNEVIEKELDEESLKFFHRLIFHGKSGSDKGGVQFVSFRSKKVAEASLPEEILAEVTELFDWYYSLYAKETHPIIVAGIIKAQIENIQPFDSGNNIVADITVRTILKNAGYAFNNYISLESRYTDTSKSYDQYLYSTVGKDLDYSLWLEYFTEEIAHEVLNTKEKILLLARDTKLAKASGRVKLTPRQERIIEHLQDYGIMQNKDFPKLFPGVSEDSILRDIKVLLNQGIVVKTGSTKSSMYELS
ncbi:hypothetical protein A3F07_02670 [candidate division WWE3 bacterium RIFCSPHIGHO2_12_FULL_38_15]|uniref:Fido domain-containing protein n=1 Tax=candidate division WWE3 bacterium RIFCSPHIGHO2_02_FULL_38_14 TaxID=1802620 RepID=A0A1F4V6U4_UNCKA|nr:MAG: hypothetical protein A2793_02725 [candidate division WWE3 bacterium RIFCSPHIGHO2_01_FULL_38_45]OGC48730.1 MAG: hypothetical protein A3F07_02670 [candidate division WWE3 bacterium RIFCSPHIGHO2_12_FULL_38_15]OGC52655.1 MAG: hypothetical protein A3B64_03975 [candidate division WWE3 bacterium RIFCSPLOWO2_01_FULL_37_24]OGC52929.1 MAG: hypothetical protein A3D91_03180 [candidate division WWE3 bacterium RIFCSPHIGHO2_02_FULL_38_14]HLB51487.1 Fic family protein [Patescibacteria group bacterium]